MLWNQVAIKLEKKSSWQKAAELQEQTSRADWLFAPVLFYLSLCCLFASSFLQLLPFPFSCVLSTTLLFSTVISPFIYLPFTIIQCNQFPVNLFCPWINCEIFIYWYLFPSHILKKRNCLRMMVACPASLAKSLAKKPCINITFLEKVFHCNSQNAFVCYLWTIS